MKPVVLVTRKLPAAVEDRLRRDYQARLNPDDHRYTSEAMMEIVNRGLPTTIRFSKVLTCLNNNCIQYKKQSTDVFLIVDS